MTHKEDLYSSILNMTVKARDATGMSAIVTTETEEGYITTEKLPVNHYLVKSMNEYVKSK